MCLVLGKKTEEPVADDAPALILYMVSFFSTFSLSLFPYNRDSMASRNSSPCSFLAVMMPSLSTNTACGMAGTP